MPHNKRLGTRPGPPLFFLHRDPPFSCPRCSLTDAPLTILFLLDVDRRCEMLRHSVRRRIFWTIGEKVCRDREIGWIRETCTVLDRCFFVIVNHFFLYVVWPQRRSWKAKVGSKLNTQASYKNGAC